MITSYINNDILLKHLLDKFQRSPVSKSALIMACHYFLKDNCESSCNKVHEIEDRLNNLINEGKLNKLIDGTLRIS